MDYDDLQFYPTPRSLAYRAWAMFKNRDFGLVLEPSAGRGDLARAAPDGYRKPTVHCIEIDVTHHDALRADFQVVGLDFMQFAGGSMYSHIIMNPPFAEGAAHVLKAWDLLWDGEIVAILNAETIRNPFSRERRQLVALIEECGLVEFAAGAFQTGDTQRKTAVDVALVYLRKSADTQADIVGDLIDGLREERADGIGGDFEEMRELALPASEITNLVRAFDAATVSLRASVFAQARHSYYAELLGMTLAARSGDKGDAHKGHGKAWVQSEMNTRYDELKDRAWAAVLRSSDVLSRLSSSGQKLVESQFAEIKRLEFTESNIRGFLLGLCENQGQIQIEMACQVFDEITRYYTDNAAFYKGWKSNDKHRTCGRRIKLMRFVLPNNRANFGGSIDWSASQRLADFDKVFAMLDGKPQPAVSLTSLFDGPRSQARALAAGERIASSYFDVRWYPGAGTIHFFPRDKALVDRLNRIVGRHRQWLPPEGAKVPESFWLQFEQAEKLDKDVEKELRANQINRGRWWDDPRRAMSCNDQNDAQHAHKRMHDALGAVHERNRIYLDERLTGTAEDAPLMLESA